MAFSAVQRWHDRVGTKQARSKRRFGARAAANDELRLTVNGTACMYACGHKVKVNM